MKRSQTEIRQQSSPSLRMVLVVEAAGDADTVAAFIDKLILADTSLGIIEETLDQARSYVEVPGEPIGDRIAHYRWRWIDDRPLTKSAFGARPAFGKKLPRDRLARKAYVAIRKVHVAAALMTETPNAIVLVHDADTEDDRYDRIAKDVAETGTTHKVCIGVPNRKREAWVLNAFEPKDADERRAKAEEDKKLGFDCAKEAERLNGDKGDVRDAKRVLRELTGESTEREREAILAIPLSKLYERGEKTGLSRFLDNVKKELLPLIPPVEAEAAHH